MIGYPLTTLTATTGILCLCYDATWSRSGAIRSVMSFPLDSEILLSPPGTFPKRTRRGPAASVIIGLLTESVQTDPNARMHMTSIEPEKLARGDPGKIPKDSELHPQEDLPQATVDETAGP